MIKNAVVFLLKETLSDPEKKNRFPDVKEDVFVCCLKFLRLNKFFYEMYYFLSERRRQKVFNGLINIFRISRVLVDAEKLQIKFKEILVELLSSEDSLMLGDYFEFGVYQGASMICMHKALKECGLDHVRIFGFDSFEGLPSAINSLDPLDRKIWKEGEYKSSIEFTRECLSEAGVDWNKTCLVKGFYSDTLTDALVKKKGMKKASVIMVDCDMYCSTVAVLNFCFPLIKKQAFIVFDDWNCTNDEGGEKLAFHELLDQYPEFEIKDFGSYCSNSQIYKITSNN